MNEKNNGGINVVPNTNNTGMQNPELNSVVLGGVNGINQAETQMPIEPMVSGVVPNQPSVYNQVGVTPPPQMPVTSEPKKKNKTLIVIVIALVVIIIGLVVAFFVLKSNKTAENYIDNNIKFATKWVSDNFDTLAMPDIDVAEEDIKITGNIEVTGTGDMAAISGLALDLDLGLSLKNDYANFGLTLKEGGENLGANLFLNKETLYAKLPDIYSETVKYDIGENIFAIIKEYTNEINSVLSAKDLDKIINNTIKYFGEALKQAKLTTDSNGMKVTYNYEINDNNKEKIANTFVTALENDEDYKELIEIINNVLSSALTTNFSDITTIENNLDIAALAKEMLPNMVISIDVNILNNRMEDFTIKMDDVTLKGTKTGEGKYRITSSQDDSIYIDLEVSETKLSIVIVEDGSELLNFSINKEGKNTKFNINMADLVKINMTTTKVSNTEQKVNGTLETEGYTFSVDATIKIDGKKISSNSSIGIKEGNTSVTINISENIEYGTNLINAIDTTGAKNLDELDLIDQYRIQYNLTNKLNNMPIISSLYESIVGLFSYNYIDDDYNYEYYDNQYTFDDTL